MKKVSIFIVFVLSFFLFSCNKATKYEDYQKYHLTKAESFRVNKETYYLFFYQKSCDSCYLIKDKVINQLKNEEAPLYFICLDNLSILFTDDIDYSNVGVTSFFDLKIYGTPEMLLIKDGAVIGQFIGSVEIDNEL